MNDEIPSVSVVSDYLNNRLSPAELDKFEQVVLDEPAFCDEVRLEGALRSGLKRLNASPSAGSVNLPKTSRQGLAFRKLIQLLSSPQWSFGSTAGLAICIALLFNSNLNQGNFPADQVDQHKVVDAIVYIGDVRSTGKLPEFFIESEQVALLSIDAEAFHRQPVSLLVTNSFDVKVFSLDATPNANATMNVLLGPLMADEYLMTLSSADVQRSYRLTSRTSQPLSAQSRNKE